jgi:DNA-binding response OmpR family regulator
MSSFSTPPAPGTKPEALAGAKILVVEDEQSVSFLICETLRDLGADPLPIEDGRGAVAILDTWPPDAILLDLMLPQLDGIGVVRTIRATCRRAGLPMPRICIMTAGWRARDVARDLDIAVYLSKPFSLAELQGAVEETLRQPPPPVDPDDPLTP